MTPDGARIVTGSADNTARVWDAKTFAELATLEGHTRGVTSVTVTPDGARIVTASYDNTARVWELFPWGQPLVADAQRVAPRCLTFEQRQRYYLASTPPRWCDPLQKWPYDAVTIANTAVSTGQQHILAGRHREAIAALEQVVARTPAAAVRLAPMLATAHDGIAWAALLDVVLRAKPAELLKDVLGDAEKAVTLAPDDSSILDTRGQIYLALGRTNEAFIDVDKAITLGVNGIGTFYARGRGHEHKGNTPAAIADYRKALELFADRASEPDDYLKAVETKTRECLVALGVKVPEDKPSSK